MQQIAKDYHQFVENPPKIICSWVPQYPLGDV